MKRIIIRDNDTQELREKGNKAFLDKDYSNAIIHYSSAIKKSPKESVLYSNRSRCFYMLKDFANSLKDAKLAIDFDGFNVKAYFLYGRCLANISKLGMNYHEAEIALRCFNSAYEICKKTSKTEFIPTCKSLKKKLHALIFLKKKENFNYQVSRLRNYYKDVIKQKRALELFDKYVVEKQSQSFPDSLCCPITLEFFKQPIITESGHSYDCNALITHFSKMGIIDPITRFQINPHSVFKNISVVNAVKWYLNKEPWAKISETLINSLDVEF